MKKIITILLTAILFAVVVVLGVNSVYRVEEVRLEINVVSEDAKAEATALKSELEQLYGNKGILGASAKDSEDVFADFPYFRLTAFTKEYPNKLVIEATEDAEVFAVNSGTEYYILSMDGTILSVRNDPANRSDGKDNVVVEGITIAGEKGEVCQSEKLRAILPLLQELSIVFDGLRSNFVKVTFTVRGSSIEEYRFQMREGVEILVRKADQFAKEKGQAIAQTYLSLSDSERLTGFIFATNGEEKATAVYYPTEISLGE